MVLCFAPIEEKIKECCVRWFAYVQRSAEPIYNALKAYKLKKRRRKGKTLIVGNKLMFNCGIYKNMALN